MGKNITLREGDTSKQFTADKIKTNLVGGGTCDWIPEDEAVDYVDLKDHTFNQAGTFLPSQFNCDGFRQVKIDIPADVKEKTITANGEYNAADDECLGYSKVTVAVPGGGGGGPFTVRFFDDDRQTILKTDANVPYGGSASCTLLDGTTVGGLYFKGWNPVPTNVKENLNCYPVRGEYNIDEHEIQDSWETICANCGANYPLGAYKQLVLTNNFSFVHRYYDLDGETYQDVTHTGNQNIALHMVKVAEGEDNTTSTWLSTGLYNWGSVSAGDIWKPFSNFDIMSDWLSSGKRVELNEGFFTQLLPCLQDTIKEVSKYFISAFPLTDNVSKQIVTKSSLDKIWVPSLHELKSYFCSRFSAGNTWQRFYRIDNNSQFVTINDDADAASQFNTVYGDLPAVNYAAIYMPLYANGFSVRDISQASLYQANSQAAVHYVVNNGSCVNYNQSDRRSASPFGFCL